MRLCRLVLVLGVAALLVGPALAQRQPGGGRGGFGFGGPGFLLQNKSVQEELKMDKEQVDKVTEALRKVREETRDDQRKLFDPNTSQEERAEIRKKINEANAKALSGILKPEQEKRLKQIERQQMNIRLFSEEDVQKALKLTDEQKDKLKTIADDTQKEIRELFSGGGRGGFGNPETQRKIQGLQKEAMESATKLLNDEQKKVLKELIGEKFEIKFDQPPGRRGGGDDRPGGGRPGGGRPGGGRPGGGGARPPF